MKKIVLFSLCLATLWLGWCSQTPKVELGDKVTISYTGAFENDKIYETKQQTITIGNKETIKGIENAILGKKEGKTVKTTISPDEGYGYKYSLNNQQRVSKLIFEKLWLPTTTGATVSLDKITGKIIGQENDKNGFPVIIFDINAAETQETMKYEIHIEKIEKQSTGYNL